MPLKIGMMLEGTPRSIVSDARRLEEIGYDFALVSETKNDPFFLSTLIAAETERLQVSTSVAIAFPRAPYITANLAWDLASYSGGRFMLGLGTQVKGHNERRFSVPWLPPGPRFRDYVLCIRAIWDSWQSRTRPDFQSDHYQYTLASPLFTPDPIEHPKIPIILAAVNPYNTRLAGEVGDGIAIHGFCSFRYIREVVLPTVHEGARLAGKDPNSLQIRGGGFVVTGRTEEDVAKIKEKWRRQISFYASTRSYSNIMKLHGWEDEAAELHRLSVEQRWDDMVNIITDEMMDEFCVIGTWDEMPAKIPEKYQGINTHLAFPATPKNRDEQEHLSEVVAALQQIPIAGE